MEEDILKLYFVNSQKKRRLIGTPATEENAWEIINNFMDEHDFECYYVRNWTTSDGVLHYDVGSHTEFFELERL